MNPNQLLLIDLSALAHQIWHISGNEPDPSFVSTQLVARVRALASQHPHSAICCDSGRSFRADLDPSYKANRDTENRAPLRHQMDVACETLRADGFPVWRVPGFEADDIIATATRLATEMDGDVLIASADKDLLQLVTDRVTFRSTSPNTDGKVFGPAEVFDKFGVRPEQMGDLLALMGDKSDNIKGAEKIGQVIGARLLSEHGTLAALYEEMEHGHAAMTDGIRKSLAEFKARWPLVASLVKLRTDVPEGDGFTFAEIAVERVAKAMEEAEMKQPETLRDALGETMHDAFSAGMAKHVSGNDGGPTGPLPPLSSLPHTYTPQAYREVTPDEARKLAMPSACSAPVDFSQQLEPRNIAEAVNLAQRMYDSRLFGDYGTPQAVLASVMSGRELGMPAMASLRSFYIRKGRANMHAAAIIAVVLKSGKAQYFRCTERTAERATYITKRGDDPEMSLTFTIEEGRAAFDGDDKAWKASGWGKNPADMVTKTAGSKLARLVYPDVVAGLYAPEEME